MYLSIYNHFNFHICFSDLLLFLANKNNILYIAHCQTPITCNYYEDSFLRFVLPFCCYVYCLIEKKEKRNKQKRAKKSMTMRK